MAKYLGTCSIDDLRDGCLTFAREAKYLEPLKVTDKEVTVIIPENMDIPGVVPSNVSFLRSSYVDYDFAVWHNAIYAGVEPDANIYYQGARIDPSIQVKEGIHVSIGPGGRRVQMKHMGNFVVGKNSIVGPLVFVERACMQGQSTVIEDNAYLDGFCMIAHQARIKENTMVATGSMICASSVIGRNCWIGIHVVVRPHVHICDNVILGIGSLVVKDITEPGIYFGAPAVKKGEYDPNWRW